MALEPVYASSNAFSLEHGVLPSTGDSAQSGDVVNCHCWSGHRLCCMLTRHQGSCLCEKFLLARCNTDAAVSGQTWSLMLSSLLESEGCSFWGSGSFYLRRSRRRRRRRRNKEFSYLIVVRVDNSAIRDKIATLIRKCHNVADGTPKLVCYNTCCFVQFFSLFKKWQKGYPEIIFGKESLHREILDLYDSRAILT